ncbi:hypothetical protein [Streptomyces sp. NPDC018610]|uniref:hypothetical protein n=1 Tax=Streptomyces sp. NPDC018610 TaxID=3365049 RepID=UPI00378CFC34
MATDEQWIAMRYAVAAVRAAGHSPARREQAGRFPALHYLSRLDAPVVGTALHAVMPLGGRATADEFRRDPRSEITVGALWSRVWSHSAPDRIR